MSKFLKPQIKDFLLNNLSSEFCDRFEIKLVYNSNNDKTKTIVTGVNTIDIATKSEICFFANGLYKKYLATTNALACFINEDNLKFLNPNNVGKEKVTAPTAVTLPFFAISALY